MESIWETKAGHENVTDKVPTGEGTCAIGVQWLSGLSSNSRKEKYLSAQDISSLHLWSEK